MNPGSSHGDGSFATMRLVAFVALLAGALLVFVAVGSFGSPEPVAPPAVPKVFTEEPPKPVAAYVETPLCLPVVKDAEAGAGMLRFPDGSFAPPLNGVKNPPPGQWQKPFSPIVGTRRGNEPGAIDWYVHADGTMSTTINVMRHDLGKVDATTIVSHPEKPLPVLDVTSQPSKN